MTRNRSKPFIPILLIAIILNGLFVIGRSRLEAWNFDQNVLIIGNSLLCVITLFSYFVATRGLRNTNPHAFMRSVYGSIMMKLFLCIIAAFIYIAAYGKSLNKPALFTLMGLYLVYTFIEVSVLTKLLKNKPNE
jgi:hypothetical protein